MSMLVADCPRCGARTITFDVTAQAYCGTEYGWQNYYEIFCVCRGCHRPTIFLVSLNTRAHGADYHKELYKENGLVKYHATLNPHFDIERFISIRDNVVHKPPEHSPNDIENAFNEGAVCLAIGCNNAAATMFRLCLDLVTRPLLPPIEETEIGRRVGPNAKARRDLGLRLAWMFDNGILPSDLRELATCVREDANDGAHVGNLTKEDAEDLLDFTTELLDRLVTEPKRLELARERREARRASRRGGPGTERGLPK
jgi:hypothetical protein